MAQFVLFAVETCAFMGKEAVRHVNRLGDIAISQPRGGAFPSVHLFARQCCNCSR